MKHKFNYKKGNFKVLIRQFPFITTLHFIHLFEFIHASYLISSRQYAKVTNNINTLLNMLTIIQK